MSFRKYADLNNRCRTEIFMILQQVTTIYVQFFLLKRIIDWIWICYLIPPFFVFKISIEMSPHARKISIDHDSSSLVILIDYTLFASHLSDHF